VLVTIDYALKGDVHTSETYIIEYNARDGWSTDIQTSDSVPLRVFSRGELSKAKGDRIMR
jgi:hypothetical protein